MLVRQCPFVDRDSIRSETRTQGREVDCPELDMVQSTGVPPLQSFRRDSLAKIPSISAEAWNTWTTSRSPIETINAGTAKPSRLYTFSPSACS